VFYWQPCLQHGGVLLLPVYPVAHLLQVGQQLLLEKREREKKFKEIKAGRDVRVKGTATLHPSRFIDSAAGSSRIQHFRLNTSVADPKVWIRIRILLWILIRILLSSWKNSKKNLKSYYFVTLFDFLSLKNDVNVASKSNKQKKLC
jgi:hypothetical protein